MRSRSRRYYNFMALVLDAKLQTSPFKVSSRKAWGNRTNPVYSVFAWGEARLCVCMLYSISSLGTGVSKSDRRYLLTVVSWSGTQPYLSLRLYFPIAFCKRPSTPNIERALNIPWQFTTRSRVDFLNDIRCHPKQGLQLPCFCQHLDIIIFHTLVVASNHPWKFWSFEY